MLEGDDSVALLTVMNFATGATMLLRRRGWGTPADSAELVSRWLAGTRAQRMRFLRLRARRAR